MVRRLPVGIALVVALGIAFPAAAQTEPPRPSASRNGAYVHLGPGALLFDANAQVYSGSAVLPGASVRIPGNGTLITEFGYRWRRLGVSLTGGIPPLASVKGAGTLAPLGELGKIRYGPTVLTMHYHVGGLGRWEPYVGGGAVLLLVFDNRDGAVSRLKVDNHWGGAVQAGVEYKVAQRLSLYLDFKKAALKTNATAVLGNTPIRANIRLNPAVVSGGLSLRL
jgi:outer membrane protein